MRRVLLKRLPALTQWTYGALNPLTVDRYTLREISEYITQMDRANAAPTEEL